MSRIDDAPPKQQRRVEEEGVLNRVGKFILQRKFINVRDVPYLEIEKKERENNQRVGHPFQQTPQPSAAQDDPRDR